MIIKDYIRELFPLLVNGKIPDFIKRGEEALTDIQKAIDDLEEQAHHIRNAVNNLNQPSLALGIDTAHIRASGLNDQQKQVLKEAAIEIAKNSSNGEVTTNQVIENVNRKGVVLTVKNQNAVVSSMLSRWKEFTALGDGRYILSKTSQ